MELGFWIGLDQKVSTRQIAELLNGQGFESLGGHAGLGGSHKTNGWA
jgi:hypothetical protein